MKHLSPGRIFKVPLALLLFVVVIRAGVRVQVIYSPLYNLKFPKR